MPSGINDDLINTILDDVISSQLGTPLYMDLLTTGPSDDNGTDAVSWGEGRVSVDMTDSGIWPSAADRQKVSTPITSATNSSGDTITVVAWAFYDASTDGNYVGGSPLPDGTLDIDDGETTDVTITLGAPSPS